jgi:hypothetical protein
MRPYRRGTYIPYSVFQQLTLLHLPQHLARVEATEAEAVLKHVIDLTRWLRADSDPCHS